MEPLKEMFNRRFYEELATGFYNAYNHFNPSVFVKEVTFDFESLSLNARMRNTSIILKNHLPGDFKKALKIMYKVIQNSPKGYTNLLFPDYVGLYGHNHFDASMEALHYFTQFGSSEFAIREFLKRDFKKTIHVMYRWAEDNNYHVRRLASEGSRPRLPWSFKLDEVIKSPSVTTPILAALNADQELFVRKSVANHLNDISKDNPDYMLYLIHQWDKSNPYTSWIIRHASRSLIKKGNSASLSVFDFEKNVRIKVENFIVHTNKIILGDLLHFEFTIASAKTRPQKLVIDYIIHYRKKSGELSPKVFKLKEFILGANQKVRIIKKQLIRDFTTRKHFPGTHLIEIQVNGKKTGKQEFHLNA